MSLINHQLNIGQHENWYISVPSTSFNIPKYGKYINALSLVTSCKFCFRYWTIKTSRFVKTSQYVQNWPPIPSFVDWSRVTTYCWWVWLTSTRPKVRWQGKLVSNTIFCGLIMCKFVKSLSDVSGYSILVSNAIFCRLITCDNLFYASLTN